MHNDNGFARVRSASEARTTNGTVGTDLLRVVDAALLLAVAAAASASPRFLLEARSSKGNNRSGRKRALRMAMNLLLL